MHNTKAKIWPIPFILHLLQLFQCFALQRSNKLISKDSGKTYAAKALRIWGFRILFCIFLALPKSIKMIRGLSTLYQALINKNIIKMEIRSGRSSEFKVTVNMTENTFALSVLQALLPVGLVLWIKMSATSAKVVN